MRSFAVFAAQDDEKAHQTAGEPVVPEAEHAVVNEKADVVNAAVMELIAAAQTLTTGT